MIHRNVHILKILMFYGVILLLLFIIFFAREIGSGNNESWKLAIFFGQVHSLPTIVM